MAKLILLNGPPAAAPGDAYDAFVAALAERPDAVVIDDPLSDAAYDSLERLLG